MDILVFTIIMLVFLVIANRFTVRVERTQELNLGKEFKEKKHLVYETCSMCGKRLKHARLGKTGDVMICSVECRGKTTWYCQVCGEKYINETKSTNPEDYIGENAYVQK